MVASTWHGSTYPDGDKNLPDNGLKLRESTQYIETTLEEDHHWISATANENGHHKQVALTTNAADLTLPSDTDGILYTKTVTNDGVDTDQLYYKTGTGGSEVVYPITPGVVWAYAVFNASTGTITKSMNVASLVLLSNFYTLTFTNQPPSANYLVQGANHYTSGGSSVRILAIREPAATYITQASFVFTYINPVNGNTQSNSSTKAMVMVIV